MDEPYKMLFQLVRGFKKWEEQKGTVPVEVRYGQRLFIKECSRLGNIYPPDFTNYMNLRK